MTKRVQGITKGLVQPSLWGVKDEPSHLLDRLEQGSGFLLLASGSANLDKKIDDDGKNNQATDSNLDK